MTTPAQPFPVRVALAMRAGEGAILVPTHEQQACVAALHAASVEVARARGKPSDRPTVLLWSSASGTRRVEVDKDGATLEVPVASKHDHLDVLAAIREGGAPPSLYVLADFDPYLRDPHTARVTLETLWAARAQGHLVAFMQRKPELPAKALMDEVSIIEHRLPERDELSALFRSLLPEGLTAPTERHVDNLLGLSSVKAASAIAHGVIDARDSARAQIDVDLLRRAKEAEIGKRPYLRAVEPSRTIDDIVGHDALKAWVSRRALGFTSKARAAGLPPPKGLLLGGPPGTGKTVFAEAVAGTWGMPLFVFDVGAAYQSHLGESEENVRDAIEVAEACAPCILMLDEVERLFPDGGGDRDGGTSQRILGKFLTWMSTKTKPVFVFMTSNHPDKLPAALVRKGRLDELFALDLPTLEERRGIFTHYLKKAGTELPASDVDGLASDAEDFSGAEIEGIVEAARFAAFAEDRALVADDVGAELRAVTPIAKSMADKVTAMRAWAQENARSTQVQKPRPAYAGSSKRKVS